MNIMRTRYVCAIYLYVLYWDGGGGGDGVEVVGMHVDVIKWKHLPLNGPFVSGIHRSQVNFPHKGQ